MGTFFERRRIELGLSRRDVAARVRPPLSTQAIGKWDRGVAMPSLALLDQLAPIYGVGRAELLNEIHQFKADKRKPAGAK